MQVVKFPEQNCTYVAEGCEALPAYKTINEQFQTDEVVSLWALSDEDLSLILKQIKAGIRPAIHLSVVGVQPPVSLWVREKRW